VNDRRIELSWKTPTSRIKETFDAVCVCNGHYSLPAFPDLPGLKEFEGRTMHSIEYDAPESFSGLRVLCVGGRASGTDLAREISLFAKEVYLSDPSLQEEKREGNVSLLPRSVSVGEEGVLFEGGQMVDVDVIIFCTGYDYHFPFINHQSNIDLRVNPGEKRVSPLYRQIWHARHTNLSFIGLPHSVVPFPLFELQAQAIAKSLTAPDVLPPLQTRLDSAAADFSLGGPNKGGVRDTHFLGSHQWDYCRDIARMAGVYDEEVENHITTNQVIYDHAGAQRKGTFPGGPDEYRSLSYTRIDDRQSFTFFKA